MSKVLLINIEDEAGEEMQASKEQLKSNLHIFPSVEGEIMRFKII